LQHEHSQNDVSAGYFFTPCRQEIFLQQVIDMPALSSRHQVEIKMHRSIIKTTFLATAVISMVSWIGLLGAGVWWLVAKF